ncbi:lysosome membrane protein 2-like [Homarus americanus]|uniref:lysosome membrane protein 2-like n=1 Tax=Homarus americanus TaxID=6706 RepID=UPI001C476764|nr:lysosome membrane protein 2-like [Homarus americanus]
MRRSICAGCLGALGLLLLILGGIVVGLFEPFVNSFVYKELVIRNGTDVYQTWKHPPVVPHLRIYFFNVTNKEEFLSGEKPVLQEVGPYCYREHWEKVNVAFHDNGTVSYETQKHYYFEREISVGSEDDIITTLNIPMVSAVSQWRFAQRLAKLALSSMLEVLNEKPFVTHTVGEFMWGYDDPLLKIAKDIIPPDQRLPYDQFGFFIEKNGSNDGLFNVFTGVHDMTKYTTIDTFNREQELSFWKTDECNQIKGTDGSSFPPGVTEDTVLYMFNENLCRSIPLTFWHDIEEDGILGMRFSPPIDVFANTTVKPDNDCYCVGGPPCIGGGVFNISICKFGSPSIISWPHFYQADPKFLNAVDGLQPDAEKHAMYIDVSPRTGSPLRAQARLQINIAIPHVPEVKPAARLREIIFPVLWFEDGVSELPANIVELLQFAENVPAVVKSSLLMAFFIIGAILVVAVGVSLLAEYFNLPIPFLNPNYSIETIEGKMNNTPPTPTHKPELTGHTNTMVSENPDNDFA